MSEEAVKRLCDLFGRAGVEGFEEAGVRASIQLERREIGERVAASGQALVTPEVTAFELGPLLERIVQNWGPAIGRQGTGAARQLRAYEPTTTFGSGGRI